MVGITCPICKSFTVGLIRAGLSLGEWYARVAPDVPVGSAASKVCYWCAYEYSAGDNCQSRAGANVDHYIVVRVQTKPNGLDVITATNEQGETKQFSIVEIMPADTDAKTSNPHPPNEAETKKEGYS